MKNLIETIRRNIDKSKQIDIFVRKSLLKGDYDHYLTSLFEDEVTALKKKATDDLIEIGEIGSTDTAQVEREKIKNKK